MRPCKLRVRIEKLRYLGIMKLKNNVEYALKRHSLSLSGLSL